MIVWVASEIVTNKRWWQFHKMWILFLVDNWLSHYPGTQRWRLLLLQNNTSAHQKQIPDIIVLHTIYQRIKFRLARLGEHLKPNSWKTQLWSAKNIHIRFREFIPNLYIISDAVSKIHLRISIFLFVVTRWNCADISVTSWMYNICNIFEKHTSK